jgi:hypothetical protein
VTAPLAVPPTRIVPVHGTRGAAVPPHQRMKLGDALVRGGVITPAQLAHCLDVQRATDPPRRLGAVVVDLGLATAEDVAGGLAAILGFDYVDPALVDVPLETVRLLPRERATELGVVPIGAGATWIRVAVADPADRRTVEAVRETTGLPNVSLAVATPDSIAAALDRFWSSSYAPAPAPGPAAEPETDTDVGVWFPVDGGWEYAYVTGSLADTEPELATLGAEGWEAVGMTAAPAGVTVLLKRRT